MASVEVEGKVLKWGNSYGVRIRKEDLQALGLHEGQTARILVIGRPGRIDLSKVTTFRDAPEASRDHDQLYGEAVSEEHEASR